MHQYLLAAWGWALSRECRSYGTLKWNVFSGQSLQLGLNEIICDLHQSTGMWLFSPNCRLHLKLWIKAGSFFCLLKSSFCPLFKVLLSLKNHEEPSSAASKTEVQTGQDGFWSYPWGRRLLKKPPLSHGTWAAFRKQLLGVQKAELESGSWLKS